MHRKMCISCIVLCARLFWFTVFDNYSEWKNMDENDQQSDEVAVDLSGDTIRTIPAWK